MLFLVQTFKTALALFIITDSIGNLPFFMGLTEGMTHSERRKIFSTALFTGLVLLMIFGFTGSFILGLFGLTIDDFKIAGGILLFFIGVEVLLKGKVIFEHKEDVGVMPLGCPLLVGPGAITSFLVLLHLYNVYAVITGMLICFLLIWVVLFFAEHIYGFIGRNGALIITKIAAIIIASIAVGFVRQGIQGIFHI